MCGIAGYVSFGRTARDLAWLPAMCDTIAHRGPDGSGYHYRDSVAMGMRRLAIIDLESGDQPISTADGRYTITYNGELYNYRELKDSLRRRHVQFSTNSDTEVVLQGFAIDGVEFLNQMRGMFAFALHDHLTQRLTLVRDQMGIKPLYYCRTPEALVWGSEIKAILQYPGIERRVDLTALGEFLRWEYVPAPNTLFAGIHKLPPATLMTIELGSGAERQQRYWQPQFDTISERSFDEHVNHLDELVTRAVEKQLISDVPLGAFLSGGVDSSLVASRMGPAQAFSIGFEDDSYNELSYARRVAAHLGLEHVAEVAGSEVVQHFQKLMYLYDDPIADFSIFPTYILSQLTSQQVTVALSGDGGDELFGGYDTHLAERLARRLVAVPDALRTQLHRQITDRLPPQSQKKGLINSIKRFAEGFAQAQQLGHARWRLFSDDRMLQQLVPGLSATSDDLNRHIYRLNAEADGADWLNKALYVDSQSYLIDNCLTKVDRASMGNSLECRVPLLDLDLVQYAFQIPAEQKLAHGESKAVLKALAARVLPRDCVYRRKQGFSIPIKQWLATQFRPLMDQYLDADRLQTQGLFDPQVVAGLATEHLGNRANHSHVLWAVIVFQAWHDRWIDQGTSL